MAKVDGGGVVRQLGSWFAEQIGCDPKDVLGIDLHFQMGEIATADVRFVLKSEGLAAGVLEQMGRYALVPMKEEPSDG